MQIEITTAGIPMSVELRDYIRHRLRLALDSVEVRVRSVKVLLQDVNGPRGGIDQRCQLRLKVEHLAEVIIDETAAELRTAIDTAIARGARSVRRQGDRQRTVRRLGRRRGAPPAGESLPAVS